MIEHKPLGAGFLSPLFREQLASRPSDAFSTAAVNIATIWLKYLPCGNC